MKYPISLDKIKAQDLLILDAKSGSHNLNFTPCRIIAKGAINIYDYVGGRD